jgi:endoglucanase
MTSGPAREQRGAAAERHRALPVNNTPSEANDFGSTEPGGCGSATTMIFKLAQGEQHGSAGRGSGRPKPATRSRVALALARSAPVGLMLATLGACEGEARLPMCPSDVPFLGGECWPAHEVRVNSLGYLVPRKKGAVAYRAGTFRVKTPEGDEVYRGETGKAVVSPDTGETLYPIDFSDFDSVGTFYLELEAGGRSSAFQVGPGALDDGLTGVMLGLYGQRCGEEVELSWATQNGKRSSFHHDACHLEPASLELIGSGTMSDVGGWHDAGDYGKYTVNGAFAVAFLLKAFEHFPTRVEALELPIPEQGGKLPDLLDEAKVELEWLLKVQLEDGSFAHKVTAKNFESTVLPERDTSERFFSPAGTAATGDAGAVLALAARLFEALDPDFSERCLVAARKAEDYLEEHTELEAPDLSEFTTGSYLAGDGDGDERLWLLSELFEATGETKYLDAFEESIDQPQVQAYFDWYGATNLAYDTYLRSVRPGRDRALTRAVGDAFVRSAEDVVDHYRADPYGRGSSSYSWGSNGAVARLALTLSGAYFVEPDAKYLDAAQGQLDYLFGRNPFGRSFLTGVGYAPASSPHHRPSMADSVVPAWPGLLVGGPHSGGSTPPVSEAALKWEDVASDYNHNEIAINWNTALAYALVFTLGAAEGGAACPELGAGGACGDTTASEPGGAGGALGGAGAGL